MHGHCYSYITIPSCRELQTKQLRTIMIRYVLALSYTRTSSTYGTSQPAKYLCMHRRESSCQSDFLFSMHIFLLCSFEPQERRRERVISDYYFFHHEMRFGSPRSTHSQQKSFGVHGGFRLSSTYVQCSSRIVEYKRKSGVFSQQNAHEEEEDLKIVAEEKLTRVRQEDLSICLSVWYAHAHLYFHEPAQIRIVLTMSRKALCTLWKLSSDTHERLISTYAYMCVRFLRLILAK